MALHFINGDVLAFTCSQLAAFKIFKPPVVGSWEGGDIVIEEKRSIVSRVQPSPSPTDGLRDYASPRAHAPPHAHPSRSYRYFLGMHVRPGQVNMY